MLRQCNSEVDDFIYLENSFQLSSIQTIIFRLCINTLPSILVQNITRFKYLFIYPGRVKAIRSSLPHHQKQTSTKNLN